MAAYTHRQPRTARRLCACMGLPSPETAAQRAERSQVTPRSLRGEAPGQSLSVGLPQTTADSGGRMTTRLSTRPPSWASLRPRCGVSGPSAGCRARRPSTTWDGPPYATGTEAYGASVWGPSTRRDKKTCAPSAMTSASTRPAPHWRRRTACPSYPSRLLSRHGIGPSSAPARAVLRAAHAPGSAGTRSSPPARPVTASRHRVRPLPHSTALRRFEDPPPQAGPAYTSHVFPCAPETQVVAGREPGLTTCNDHHLRALLARYEVKMESAV
jgi:hypothetical protein